MGTGFDAALGFDFFLFNALGFSCLFREEVER